MMRVLHLDASARFQQSNSRILTAYFVAQLRNLVPGLQVDYLDVAAEPIPHVSEAYTAAMYTPPSRQSAEMRESLRLSDKLVDRLMATDAMVFGIPMYNFGLPSAFKAFIDHIVRPGRTFNAGPNNTIIGKLGDRRAVFVTTRGLDLSPGSVFENLDILTPSLRAAFGFIGLTNIVFVDAQPMQFAGEERKLQALSQARAELERIAGDWANTPNIPAVAYPAR